MDDQVEWLSTRSAAAYLDTTVATLSDWRYRGIGPEFRRISDRFIRYQKSALDAFMEGRK